MNNKTLLSGLIKFGDKEYMERLLHLGEICMHRLSYYREHNEKEISDSTEGTVYTSPVSRTKIFINGQYIHNDRKKGSLRALNRIVDPFLYCMYGEYIKSIDEYKKEVFIDPRVYDFGNAAVIIHSPKIFIERIKKIHSEILSNKIEYINENKYSGEMGYFKKYNDYKHQQEYRMVLLKEKSKEEIIIFKIGSINDIARIEYF